MLFLATSSINIPTIIGALIILILFVLAVRASIRNHKNGCSSCSNKSCASCSSTKKYEEALKDTISKKHIN